MSRLTEVKLVLTADLREHEHAGIIPEMTVDEWAEFIANVRERSEILKPVEILPDGRIIDGRHRWRAAKECGLEYVPVIVKELDDAQVIEEMRDSGLRRNLTPGQRAAIVLKCEGLVTQIKAKAREKKRESAERTNAKLGRLSSGTVLPDLAKPTTKHTHVELAEKARIGKSSMQYLQSIQRKAPDLFDRVASGEMTINKAHTEMKRREQPANVVRLPNRPSANRQRLDEISRQLKTEPEITQIDGDSLSADNLLRHRASSELPSFASKLIYDHDALQEASRESIDAYLSRLKHIVEGALLIISEYDESDYIREMTGQVSMIIRQSKSIEGQKLIANALGGNVQ